MSEPVFKLIKVVDLIPTEDNPRQVNESTEQFKTLLDSVRADGVKIPVVVRPHPKKKGKYDLRCGARRLRPAIKAQIDKIPALVYEPMTDEEAFDITFVENFAREDLLPMEEAKAVQILLGAHANDFAAVASKLGKPERWVRMLNNINSKMSDYFKDQLDTCDFLKYFTSAHIAVITRFPADAQKAIVDQLDMETKYSIKDLEKITAGFLRILSKAPFTDVQECHDCPKRSGFQPMLWVFKTGDKGDRCLDSGCWDKKVSKFYADKAKELSKEHGKVKLAILEPVGWEKRNEFKKRFKGVMFSDSVKSSGAKKDKKKTVPVLVVAGKDVGKLRWIERYGGHSASSGSVSPAADKPKTLKQLKAELKGKRWDEVLDKCQELLKGKTPPGIKHPNPTFCVIALQVYFGSECDYYSDKADKGFCDIMELVKKSPAKAEKQAIEGLLKIAIDGLGYMLPKPIEKQGLECLRLIMGLFAVDVDKIFAEVCKLDEFKEPAEWATLKADDTPKADTPKAKKTAAKKVTAKKKAAQKTPAKKKAVKKVKSS